MEFGCGFKCRIVSVIVLRRYENEPNNNIVMLSDIIKMNPVNNNRNGGAWNGGGWV